jgi:DNA-binding Lrp family transcriptional regulator
MSGLEPRQARLLEELQRDFPLVDRPFREIGRRCGLGEEETIALTGSHLAQGLIREIAALIDGRRLGYHSALVAVRAGNRAEELAARVSSHPGVSHNYLREHDWNLWFTLAVPPQLELAAEVQPLVDGAEAMILPAVRTFKLRMLVRLSENPSPEREPIPPEEAGFLPAPTSLSPFEARLVDRLQNALPLVARPWEQIAAGLQTEQEKVLAAIDELKKRGVIRRIAAVLRHRRAGYQANALVCFRLPDARLAEAGAEAARLPQVSHCYQRESRPQWPYSLYAMVHARSRDECDALVRDLAARIASEDHQLLYSVREFKKQRIRYFGAQS